MLIKAVKPNMKLRLTVLCIGAAAMCLFSCPAAAKATARTCAPAHSIAVTAAEQSAAPEKVIVLGSLFGVKLYTDGVIVASLSDLYTDDGMRCPAREAGIRPGDYLLEADGEPIESNGELAAVICSGGGKAVMLKVRRDDRVFEVSVSPVVSDGAFKTGMWVRDSAAGIGTLTFCDPATGAFAGLGHGICDMDAGGVMEMKTGQPAPVELCGITKGRPDAAGQLRGYFSSDDDLGVLEKNIETGLYGTLDSIPDGETAAVTPREQVTAGPAEILASVDDGRPRLYEAEIIKICSREQPTRNFIIKVTDPRLIALTGGIVQGMSGCPIMRDGNLLGAVTHVFVEDPTMGYGIFAQTMCEEMAR